MADEITRSAARLAALVAVPVALLVGVAAFALLSAGSGDGTSGDDGSGDGGAPGSAQPTVQATGPVEMPARSLSERQEIVCRALLSQLPNAIDGLPQRPVTAGPEQNSAYGDPPIMVSCGGPEPAYQLTDKVYPPSGVCWHPTKHPDTTVWTTLDREVPVRVTVPRAYDPPYPWVVEFSPTIIETVLSSDDAPSGCHAPS